MLTGTEVGRWRSVYLRVFSEIARSGFCAALLLRFFCIFIQLILARYYA